MGRKGPTEYELMTIDYLYNEKKLSQSKIAEMLGRTQSGIYLIMKSNGIDSDPKRRRDQRGDKNHSYVNGLSRSSVRRKVKSIILENGISRYTCQKCNKEYDTTLQVHHKDEDRSNNTLDNLIVLCAGCHMKEHYKDRKIDELGRLKPYEEGKPKIKDRVGPK